MSSKLWAIFSSVAKRSEGIFASDEDPFRSELLRLCGGVPPPPTLPQEPTSQRRVTTSSSGDVYSSTGSGNVVAGHITALFSSLSDPPQATTARPSPRRAPRKSNPDVVLGKLLSSSSTSPPTVELTNMKLEFERLADAMISILVDAAVASAAVAVQPPAFIVSCPPSDASMPAIITMSEASTPPTLFEEGRRVGREDENCVKVRGSSEEDTKAVHLPRWAGGRFDPSGNAKADIIRDLLIEALYTLGTTMAAVPSSASSASLTPAPVASTSGGGSILSSSTSTTGASSMGGGSHRHPHFADDASGASGANGGDTPGGGSAVPYRHFPHRVSTTASTNAGAGHAFSDSVSSASLLLASSPSAATVSRPAAGIKHGGAGKSPLLLSANGPVGRKVSVESQEGPIRPHRPVVVTAVGHGPLSVITMTSPRIVVEQMPATSVSPLQIMQEPGGGGAEISPIIKRRPQVGIYAPRHSLIPNMMMASSSNNNSGSGLNSAQLPYNVVASQNGVWSTPKIVATAGGSPAATAAAASAGARRSVAPPHPSPPSQQRSDPHSSYTFTPTDFAPKSSDGGGGDEHNDCLEKTLVPHPPAISTSNSGNTLCSNSSGTATVVLQRQGGRPLQHIIATPPGTSAAAAPARAPSSHRFQLERREQTMASLMLSVTTPPVSPSLASHKTATASSMTTLLSGFSVVTGSVTSSASQPAGACVYGSVATSSTSSSLRSIPVVGSRTVNPIYGSVYAPARRLGSPGIFAPTATSFCEHPQAPKVTTTNHVRTTDSGGASDDVQYPYGDFLKDFPCYTVNQYALLDSIGKGCQGEVFSCLDMQTGVQRAIKVIPRPMQLLGAGAVGSVRLNVSAARKLRQLQREVAIMKRCRHRNILALYEVIDDPEHDEMYLVMQLAQGALLKISATGEASRTFTVSDVIHYGQQLCSGLKYLHERGIVHRDIKPDNVLLGDDNIVMLGDFGISNIGMMHENVSPSFRHAGRSGSVPICNGGTPAFMAPECFTTDTTTTAATTTLHASTSSEPTLISLTDPSHDSSSRSKPLLPAAVTVSTMFEEQCRKDVWALGMTLYVMRYGKLPWQLDGTLETLVRHVTLGVIPFASSSSSGPIPPQGARGEHTDKVPTPPLETANIRAVHGRQDPVEPEGRGPEVLPSLFDIPYECPPEFVAGNKDPHDEVSTAPVDDAATASALSKAFAAQLDAVLFMMLLREPSQRLTAAQCCAQLESLEQDMDRSELTRLGNSMAE